MSDTSTTTMIATLRRVADLLAEHPEIPAPYINIYDSSPERADLNWYFQIAYRSKEGEQKDLASSVIKAIGGKWDKRFNEEDADFKQTRDGLAFHVTVKREAVCRRVVTGTEMVTIPAVPAEPEREELREIVEWDCGSLLDGASA